MAVHRPPSRRMEANGELSVLPTERGGPEEETGPVIPVMRVVRTCADGRGCRN